MSSTRSFPYLVDSPLVVPKVPGSAMSSPSRNTRSSAAKAWSSARFSASRNVISCSSPSATCVDAVALDTSATDVAVELVGGRGGRGEHGGERVLDGRDRVGVDLVELHPAADAVRREERPEPRDRIGLQSRGHSILRDVGHRIAEVVTVEPERDALEQRRAVTAPRALDRVAERREHRERVVAVDADAGHAVAGGAVGHVFDLHGVLGRRHLRVLVVLADQHHREVPERGHVHRLVERAGVGRAVTEAHHRDAIEPFALRCHCEADADRQARAHDPGREHHARLRPRDVHRPALAPRRADLAAQHLAVDLDERHALADEVVQTAVRRDQPVVRAQTHTHRGGDRLLPARWPVHAVELAGPDALAQPVVRGLHEHHQLVEPARHLG